MYNYVGDEMKIYGNEANQDIIIEIGKRIKARRISFSLTQEEISLRSGVSLRTIIEMEKGKNVSLLSLIPVLKVLKLSDNLELLVSENKTDPFDVIELGHNRKRVSRKKKIDTGWKWGDEK